MNRFYTVLFFCFSWISTTVAQLNPHLINRVVNSSEDLSFTLISNVDKPVVASSLRNGVINVTKQAGNNYIVTYTPRTNFVGVETFVMKSKTFEANPSLPTEELTTVFIDVVKSKVQAKNDFIYIDGNNAVTIFPLENDVSESNTHKLTSIVQTMYGDASIANDNSIRYTPSSSYLDYVIYTIEDAEGTTSTATLYIKKMEYEHDKSYSYTISATQSQFVLLDGQSYVLTKDAQKGKVEFVKNNVIKFTPTASGQDHIELVSSTGKNVSIDIEILNSYIDKGVVKDDRFYTSVGNEVIFDVLENDLDNSLTIDLANTSKELEYLGEGKFSYTPHPSFSGVKSFSYRARNSSVNEKGLIDIVVSDFAPSAKNIYTFSVPTGSTLSLPYDVPLETASFQIVSAPQFGELTFFEGNMSIAVSCGDIIHTSKLLYTPYDGYQGKDEYEVRYCPNDNDVRCKYLKTKINVTPSSNDCACVENCIWSGDANNDGIVDMFDVLTIAGQLGTKGEGFDESNEWKGNKSALYNDKINHADANGDGIVTIEDIEIVKDNYGKIHSYSKNNVLAVKDFPFYLTAESKKVGLGDKMVINVLAGTRNYPLIDVQGIAFSVNFLSDFIDSSSVKVSYPKGGFFVRESPFVSTTLQPRHGIVHTSVCKSSYDRHVSTSNGAGLLAKLEFIVEEELEGLRPSSRSLDFNGYIRDRIVLDNIFIQDTKGDAYQLPSVYFDYLIDQPDLERRTIAYPNPTDEILYVPTKEEDEIIQIIDILGRIIHTQRVTKNEVTRIDVSKLKFGSYILNIVSSVGVHSEKVQLGK